MIPPEDTIRRALGALSGLAQEYPEAEQDDIGVELAKAALTVLVAERDEARQALAQYEAVVDAATFVIEQEELHVANPSDEWWRTHKPFWMYRLKQAVAARAVVASAAGEELGM